jgi:1-pyrroline-5-carboxylate dehydrogenase
MPRIVRLVLAVEIRAARCSTDTLGLSCAVRPERPHAPDTRPLDRRKPMSNARFRVPTATNEPVLSYAPGTPERTALRTQCGAFAGEQFEIPLIIGGKEVRTGRTASSVMPHRHGHVLATWHKAGAAEVAAAAEACKAASAEWAAMSWDHRASIFLKAADLLAGPWRQVLNAATVLGQSKTAHQAEIDAACELIDFFRFNAEFMQELYTEQPLSSPGCWNRVEQRPLEGFVFAVTPFNFTSIAGNLPTAPALMGNTAIWKPASSAVYSAWWIMKLLEEAGLPPGVINFVPGSGAEVGDPVLAHPDFAGVHFTGSTAVFQGMWASIGANIRNYRSYPRIVGETGGKDFVFAHPSADIDALCVALVRGAFEYQGQKCSAASRAYIPQSLWAMVKDRLVSLVESIQMGDPTEFGNFMGAVIDKGAFRDITGYIDHAKSSPDADILVGGDYDDSEGYFVRPTVIVTTNPSFKSMVEEIFGPVLTIFVYEDARIDEALRSCDTASAYALTGAVFAQDRRAIVQIADALRNTAGNFYINDKPTGAVVGQQPFGGGRASGTNDKAGSKLNLMRWTSVRTIKETFVPATEYRYPYMGAD